MQSPCLFENKHPILFGADILKLKNIYGTRSQKISILYFIITCHLRYNPYFFPFQNLVLQKSISIPLYSLYLLNYILAYILIVVVIYIYANIKYRNLISTHSAVYI